MKPEEWRRAFKLLFENFWIVRTVDFDSYNFLRRHQNELQKELRRRFGMSLVIRQQYIQLLKRPHKLASWMGDIGFQSSFDYALFCCAMAYVEGLENETPFMLDELIRDLELLAPEEIFLDWTNYNQRKSLVRVIKKLQELHLIEKIQGEEENFEQSEMNQEVLFTTTTQARAFLSRAPQSYIAYESFEHYWQDLQTSRNLEGNQLLYQRLMMEPVIYRTAENEEIFVRLRNYYFHTQEYIEDYTDFYFELYRDYAAFTLEKREGWSEVFPSRRVVDEILIQLVTILRADGADYSVYGVIELTVEDWEVLVRKLQQSYSSYWSKEFKEMSLEQLSVTLLNRAKSWQLIEENETISILPVFGRLIAEMEAKI